jgi:hypothetical protein
MTTSQQADEIEALRVLMAHYALWGDTQQWENSARCFTAMLRSSSTPARDPIRRPTHASNLRPGGVHCRDERLARGRANRPRPFSAGDRDRRRPPRPRDLGMHDYIKTPVVKFNGYGHISHDHLKVDGQWKIIRVHTTRLIVDEEWLTEPQ